MRMAGLNVGKVRAKRLDAKNGDTIAELEIDEQYAPIPRGHARRCCASRRCSARPTWSSRPAPGRGPILDDGERLPDTAVSEAVEIDEIISLFDKDHPAQLPGLDPRAGHRDRQGPRRGPQRRDRQPAAVRGDRRRRARGARLPGARAAAAGAQLRPRAERGERAPRPAARADRERQRHLRRAGLAQRVARRGDVHLPDLPRRVEGHPRAAEDLRARHPSAGARPRARGARPAAHAARRGQAGARPQGAVPQPRPADRRVAEDAALGRPVHPRRRAAVRGAAPLPRGAQPDPVLPELQPAAGGRLHHQRRRLAERHAPAAERAGGPAPLPARLQRDQRARRGHQPHAPELRPRQRLPGAQLPAPSAPARDHRGVRLQAHRRREEGRHQRRAAVLRRAQVALRRRAVPDDRPRRGARARPTRRATWAPSPPRRERAFGRGRRRRAGGADGAGGAHRAGIEVDLLREGRPARAGCGPTGRRCPGAYRSLHLNTSRARTELAVFPMPSDWPDFPSHEHIGEYFARYVDRCGRSRSDPLRGRRSCGRSGRRPAAGSSGRGWLRRGSSTCWWWRAGTTGSRGCPIRRTRARSTAARCMRTTTARPTELDGRRVLVVGMGNSAMDIAVESSTVAERDLPLHPPRHAGSCPSTCSASRPTRSPRRPWPGCRGRCASRSPTFCYVSPSASPRPTACPRRDSGFLRDHPTISDAVLSRLTHGEIAVKPGIEAARRRQRWCSPTAPASEVDTIVWCTGYRVTVPYIDRRGARRCRRMSCRCSSGCSTTSSTTCSSSAWCRPPARRFPVVERQSELLADHLTGRYALPPAAKRRARRRSAAATPPPSATASTSARTCAWSSTASCASWRWSTGAARRRGRGGAAAGGRALGEREHDAGADHRRERRLRHRRDRGAAPRGATVVGLDLEARRGRASPATSPHQPQ